MHDTVSEMIYILLFYIYIIKYYISKYDLKHYLFKYNLKVIDIVCIADTNLVSLRKKNYDKRESSINNIV